MRRLLARPLGGGRVLVVGCGRGVEIRIALDKLSAGWVDAFDLDEGQIRRAKRRLKGHGGSRACLWIGDATAIATRDSQYDAVIDWGIIHHVRDWRGAIKEVARVLKSDGQFIFVEVPGHKIRSPHYRLLLSHPQEDRFELDEFCRVCEEHGLDVGGRISTYFGFFFGVAVKR